MTLKEFLKWFLSLPALLALLFLVFLLGMVVKEDEEEWEDC